MIYHKIKIHKSKSKSKNNKNRIRIRFNNKNKIKKNNQSFRKIGHNLKYLILRQICQMTHFLVNIEENKRMIQISTLLLKELKILVLRSFYFQRDILKMLKYL
jgi:hypothetical protein